MPVVSVILPTFNRAHLLGRAITSVFNQTFRDFELIVVDDGSTDDTERVLGSFSSSQLRIVKLPRNLGPANARNVGIQAARGDFIAFQDSDDEWLPHKLDQQVEAIQRAVGIRPVGACYSRVIFLRETNVEYFPTYNDSSLLEGNIYPRLLEANAVDTPALLVYRHVLNAVGGFDEHLTWLEDWDLALRIAQTYDFVFVPEPTIISHWSIDGVNSRRDPRSWWRILNKHLESYAQFCPEVGAESLWQAGDQLIKQGNVKLGRQALKHAIRLVPQKHIVLAYAGSSFGSSAYRQLSHIFGYARRRKTVVEIS
jgi:glycosyltransferase involved in cell wall biosynthesis